MDVLRKYILLKKNDLFISYTDKLSMKLRILMNFEIIVYSIDDKENVRLQSKNKYRELLEKCNELEFIVNNYYGRNDFFEVDEINFTVDLLRYTNITSVFLLDNTYSLLLKLPNTVKKLKVSQISPTRLNKIYELSSCVNIETLMFHFYTCDIYNNFDLNKNIFNTIKFVIFDFTTDTYLDYRTNLILIRNFNLDLSKYINLEKIIFVYDRTILERHYGKQNIDVDKFIEVMKLNDSVDYNVSKNLSLPNVYFSKQLVLPYGCTEELQLIEKK